MSLDICTLTGADAAIAPSDLFQLSNGYPFVEWGILFHEARQGHGRYPPLRWIQLLVELMPQHPNAKFALHLCGRSAVTDLLQQQGTVTHLARQIGRIQLNLSAASVDAQSVAQAIEAFAGIEVITQHNVANASIFPEVHSPQNHAFLFDESGGQGISPVSWPNPISARRCGYAGGLGPENLASELPRIAKTAGANGFWVDMEAKLRDEQDRFDLRLAERCLAICADFRRGA